MIACESAILICSGLFMLLYMVILVLVISSLVKIYRIITYNFATWSPNKCFIGVQLAAFIAPFIVLIVVVAAYIPRQSRDVMSVKHLALYNIQ